MDEVQELMVRRWVPTGTRTTCPKCGVSALRRRWEAESSDMWLNGVRYPYRGEPYPERLSVTCQTCGYQWAETPKDAGELERPALEVLQARDALVTWVRDLPHALPSALTVIATAYHAEDHIAEVRVGIRDAEDA